MAQRHTIDFMPDYTQRDFDSGVRNDYYSNVPKTETVSFGGMTKAALYKSFDVRANEKAETDFSVGDIIEHKKFGRGKVLNVIPLGNDKKIEIEFDSGEHKNLMALFANLKKIQ